VKDCGNIVCFRNLKKATDESLAIFGDENAAGIVFMKPFEDYYKNGYVDTKGENRRPYIVLVEELLKNFPVELMGNIYDEEKKKEFIRLFGELLRLRNILSVFDAFDESAKILSDMDFADYQGWYNNYYEEFRRTRPDGDKEAINDDLVFEIELMRHDQINVRYILELIQKYHDSNCRDAELVARISREISASPDLRDKKELIERFIERMTPEKGKDMGDEWVKYIEQEKARELETIINEENLKEPETKAFVERAFKDGFVTETGTGIAKILPPTNPFLPESGEKKQIVIEKLKRYLSKFLNTVE
jgi:type I restriction enzyme R subunit